MSGSDRLLTGSEDALARTVIMQILAAGRTGDHDQVIRVGDRCLFRCPEYPEDSHLLPGEKGMKGEGHH
jgi:hypothetical protein